MFEDDFSNAAKSGLEDNLQATDYSRGFHAPGVYHLKDVKAGTTNWELYPEQVLWPILLPGRCLGQQR